MELTRAYSTLGIGLDAPHGAVRSAYRTQLLRHHPDTGGSGDPVALATIRSAYRTIVSHDVPRIVNEQPRRPRVDVYA